MPVFASSSVPAWGAVMLGVFIGYMVWYFIVRFKVDQYTTVGLVAVVGVIAGGLVIEFMDSGGISLRDRWWYPIGLVIGWGVFVIFTLFNWIVKKMRAGPGDDVGTPFPALIPPTE